MCVLHPQPTTKSPFRSSIPFLSVAVLPLGEILRPKRRVQNDGIPPFPAACLDAQVNFGCGLAALQIRRAIPRAETHQEIL